MLFKQTYREREDVNFVIERADAIFEHLKSRFPDTLSEQHEKWQRKKSIYNEELRNATNTQHPRAYQNFFDQLQREIFEYRRLFRSNSKLLSLKKYEDYKKKVFIIETFFGE